MSVVLLSTTLHSFIYQPTMLSFLLTPGVKKGHILGVGDKGKYGTYCEKFEPRSHFKSRPEYDRPGERSPE